MSFYLIDTNILLDVIGADHTFGEKSRAALKNCAAQGTLVINPIIYAEVGAMIESQDELNDLLPEELFRRESIPWPAAFLAGQAFQRYRQNRGLKPRMLADFLIGAHAAVTEYILVSRDQGYQKYFKLAQLDPASN